MDELKLFAAIGSLLFICAIGLILIVFGLIDLRTKNAIATGKLIIGFILVTLASLLIRIV